MDTTGNIMVDIADGIGMMSKVRHCRRNRDDVKGETYKVIGMMSKVRHKRIRDDFKGETYKGIGMMSKVRHVQMSGRVFVV